jgi:5-methylcytosine-specific restriction protein A
MKLAKYIVYRRLTTTDFFNINKPTGIEEKGGGQSYIDIPISDVTLAQWKKFFAGVAYEDAHSGPKWSFIVNSIGLTTPQLLVISQRRPATFSIRSQKLLSKESNRVFAWRPDHGFPLPKDPTKREPIENLVIYIAKTEDNEFWAGWFQNTYPFSDPLCKKIIAVMLDTNSPAGFIDLAHKELYFDETNSTTPFVPGKPYKIISKKEIPKKVKSSRKEYKPLTESEIIQHLFQEDANYKSGMDEKKKEAIIKVRKRNTKAAKWIRKLYGGKCQLTGGKYLFLKKDGTQYSEVHHLIPLGEGGADSPFNLVVVSSMIHDMLHYATVSKIDLKAIKDNKLQITINGEPYTITWHPQHVALINNTTS